MKSVGGDEVCCPWYDGGKTRQQNRQKLWGVLYFHCQVPGGEAYKYCYGYHRLPVLLGPIVPQISIFKSLKRIIAWGYFKGAKRGKKLTYLGGTSEGDAATARKPHRPYLIYTSTSPMNPTWKSGAESTSGMSRTARCSKAGPSFIFCDSITTMP